MVMCIQKNNWQKSVLYVVWFSSSYSSLSLEKLMTERKNQREKKKGIAEFPFPNLYEKRGKEDWIVVSSFMMKKKNLKWKERKERKKKKKTETRMWSLAMIYTDYLTWFSLPQLVLSCCLSYFRLLIFVECTTYKLKQGIWSVQKFFDMLHYPYGVLTIVL